MPNPTEGFTYVSDDEAGTMAQARTGARITLNPRQPPWIVVSHSIKSVCVARWPGRLWRARIVDTTNVPQPLSNATYTRAAIVDVLDEIPASHLFGEHGAAVCAVITKASQLEIDQVKALAQARHPAASKAYSRAWNTWLTRMDASSAYEGEDLTSTLAIHAGGSQSPINNGLKVVFKTVFERAKLIAGPAAIQCSEDGDAHLAPTWDAAASTMLEAAMAFGAPIILKDEDRRIMSAAWNTVIGPDPITAST